MKSLEQLFAKVGVTEVRSFIVPLGQRTVIFFGDLAEGTHDRSTSSVVSSLLKGASESVAAPMLEIHGNTAFPLVPNVAELMDFSQALAAMKAGYPLARAEWSDKKQYVRAAVITKSVNDKTIVGVNLVRIDFSGRAPENAVAPWTPSAEDIMTDDWEILIDTYLTSEAQKLRKPPPPETA